MLCFMVLLKLFPFWPLALQLAPCPFDVPHHCEFLSTSLRSGSIRYPRPILYISCFRPQLSSVAQWCPTLCGPIDCSMPGFPVHHQLPELTQTHDHRVGDAIQLSHPLLSPFPPAFNLSQHQGLYLEINHFYKEP